MSPALKFLIGLAAAILMGWIYHGPLGNGERLVSSIERQAQAALAQTGLPVQAQLGRDPLSRTATLSGNADRFQREGQGSLKGINDIIAEVPGISGYRWADEPERSAMPLLVESLIQIILAYLLGLGLAWLIWGRKRREGFY
ncbi:MAG TPA: hypothetical protein VGD10_11020 [Allosphingosinicella sp.]|uniref:hypothetical protein n=1 Tax=Allosphingosinicella sp. TaxID=2823234 RepID=UPI002ED9C958